MKNNFSNLLKQNNDEDKPLSDKSKIGVRDNKISKPLVIFGTIISISSIFLLLFTINNKFG